MSFQAVGDLARFPDGRAVEVRIGARRIAVFRLGGEVFALKNLCPHEGERLDRLPASRGHAVCPGHGWRFELRTGKCVRGDATARVAAYPVKVEDGQVWIDIG